MQLRCGSGVESLCSISKPEKKKKNKLKTTLMNPQVLMGNFFIGFRNLGFDELFLSIFCLYSHELLWFLLLLFFLIPFYLSSLSLLSCLFLNICDSSNSKIILTFNFLFTVSLLCITIISHNLHRRQYSWAIHFHKVIKAFGNILNNILITGKWWSWALNI